MGNMKLLLTDKMLIPSTKILILPKYLATYFLKIDTGSVLGKEKLR